jgi:protein-disulfide isomerase
LPNADGVVAEVDGVRLTLPELEHNQGTALFQAQNSFYEAERKVVEDLLDQYLLERQARKENVTVSELLKRHVDGVIEKDPDESALHVYYEGLDTKESYEQVRGKILEHIRSKRVTQARTSYLESLRKEAKIAVLVSPPRAPISLASTPVRGRADAPVVLVEYADYECPYCQQMQPQLDKLESVYKGRIAFAYKDLPLPMHPHAQKAAEAAHCAGAQNKYWEYHDLLLKTKQLDVAQLKADARELGLDEKIFNSCLDSGQKSEAVKATLEEAQKLGLQGTPSFFLNGRFLSGIMSYDQIQQVVEEELKHSSSTQTIAAR